MENSLQIKNEGSPLFENENENENELIIQINDETESFIHSNEEDDDVLYIKRFIYIYI